MQNIKLTIFIERIGLLISDCGLVDVVLNLEKTQFQCLSELVLKTSHQNPQINV